MGGDHFTPRTLGRTSTLEWFSLDILTVNCGTVSASFAFLVVGLGVLIFGIYAAKQRSRSPILQEEPEEVIVDKEGWETKASEDEGRNERKDHSDEQGWEKKPGV